MPAPIQIFYLLSRRAPRGESPRPGVGSPSLRSRIPAGAPGSTPGEALAARSSRRAGSLRGPRRAGRDWGARIGRAARIGRRAGLAAAAGFALLSAPGCSGGWDLSELSWLPSFGAGAPARALVLARPVAPAVAEPALAPAGGRWIAPGPAPGRSPGQVLGAGPGQPAGAPAAGARTILVGGAAAARAPVWVAEAGETLMATLGRWGVRAGVPVFWEACDAPARGGGCIDWLNQAGGSVEGSFEVALGWLLAGHGEADPRPVAVRAANGAIRILADGSGERGR